ncbi:MAG: hypothetical protein K2J48_06410 [Muribaculaceae bacterium]|nr:hypothetical protein [Muribaculaceae bacterium]
MKKSVNLLLMVVMVIAMAACGGRNDRLLKAQIESGQKHCPMNLGMAGKLTGMSYDDETGEVGFVITLNKKGNVKELQDDAETAKGTLKVALQQGDMKKLVDMMVDADASLKVVYKERGSKDEFEVKFSNAELKDIKDNPLSEQDVNKLLLDQQIKMEKNKIPYKVEKGLTVSAIEDNGEALVYVCDVDEDLYELDDMGNAKDELKENMRKMMRDRTMRKQAEILASLNKGFEYHYVGNKSGKKVIVAFTGAELVEIAGKKK